MSVRFADVNMAGSIQLEDWGLSDPMTFYLSEIQPMTPKFSELKTGPSR